MDATCGRRELRVLEAVISDIGRSPETSTGLDARDIAASTGLSFSDVSAALQTLDGRYVTLVRTGTLLGWHVTAETADACRAVGQWPSAEDRVEQLAIRNGEAAEREPDQGRKGRLLAVARGLAEVARDIAVELTAGYLKQAAHLP